MKFATVVLLFIVGCNYSPQVERTERTEFFNPIKKITTGTCRAEMPQIVKQAFYPGNILYMGNGEGGAWLYTDTNGKIYSEKVFFECANSGTPQLVYNAGSATYPCLFNLGENVLVIERRAKERFVLRFNLGKPEIAANDAKVPRLGLFEQYYNMNDERNQYFYNNQGAINLLANYGLKKGKGPNYIDENIFIKVHNDNSTQKLEYYPKEYFRKTIYNRGAVFQLDTANNLYYTMEGRDSIFKIDENGQELAHSVLHVLPDRKDFDESQNKNLAYVRKYLHGIETNLVLKIINNKYVLVIKQLPQNDIRVKSKYKYFIMDSNLNKIYADTVRYNVFPYPYVYDKGFYLLSDSLTKYYRYEVN